MKQIKQLIKTKKKLKCMLIVIILLTLIIGAFGIRLYLLKIKNAVPVVDTVSSLKKVLEISDLETANIYYNAVATKRQENSDKIDYYASYEGSVTAGVDFDKTNFNKDEETKIITVTLPKAEIIDYSVNAGTIEYIFINAKSQTESVAQEAYKLCLEDLENRTKTDAENLLSVAGENAKRAVEGLFSPWMMQENSEYTIVIEQEGLQ